MNENIDDERGIRGGIRGEIGSAWRIGYGAFPSPG